MDLLPIIATAFVPFLIATNAAVQWRTYSRTRARMTPETTIAGR
jgi:hypothetical protein